MAAGVSLSGRAFEDFPVPHADATIARQGLLNHFGAVDLQREFIWVAVMMASDAFPAARKARVSRAARASFIALDAKAETDVTLPRRGASSTTSKRCSECTRLILTGS
jgi:hypothetical protein